MEPRKPGTKLLLAGIVTSSTGAHAAGLHVQVAAGRAFDKGYSVGVVIGVVIVIVGAVLWLRARRRR